MKPTAPTVLLLCGLLGGCGLWRSESYPSVDPTRPAVDVPARFEPAEATLRVAPADTLAGGGCVSPLVDPRDGAVLRMERSGVERGDYAVPEGRYGVGARELLQLWCNTGRPIGVVRR